MAVFFSLFLFDIRSRRELTAFVFDYMARDDSSSSDESSEEEEVMIALCELRFSTLALGPRVNLEDLSPLECEQLFRYDYYYC